MSSFEAIGWILLSAFCLHQLEIVDVPTAVQQYTGVNIQQVSSNGSNAQQPTGQPAEDSATVGATKPNPEGTEAGISQNTAIQPQ